MPCPDGRLTFCSLFAGRRCLCQQRHGYLLIVHHHWQHSCWSACSSSKLPIAPMVPRWETADALASSLTYTTVADASMNYSEYVPQRPRKSSHRPDGKIADKLALTHACTTANASVNYSMYVPQRPSKVPIAPMGFSHVLRLCLQGGGVFVHSGSVTFSSCTITSNTAVGYVRAHVQKFPSPRWENG